jgi:hypothetical protein
VNLAWVLLLAGLGSDGGADRDAGPPAWLPQTKRIDLADEAAYGLRREGTGYAYESPHFEAKVARDGLVSFKDRHGSAALSIFPFSLMKNAQTRRYGPAVGDTARDPTASRRAPWLAPLPENTPAQRPLVQSEICPPNSSCYVPPTANIVEVRGTFDLTDELMRALGQDPYSFEKARFLSATFEFRIKLAMETRKVDMKRAIESLPSKLDELWGDERYSALERRRILYELWYETDKSPDGERAATIIRDFVRRRLPCAERDGYTDAELGSLNRSHPDRSFAPDRDCQSLPAGAPPQ